MSIDWKLLFHQLFALEIKKEFVLGAPLEEQEDIYTRLLNGFVQYSPQPSGDVIEAAMQAASPEEAYEIRTDFYEHPVCRALIRDLDLSRCIDGERRIVPCIAAYIKVIEENAGRAIDTKENFFESPEGTNVFTAFAYDGAENEQSVALVMVPGYAAHTIAYAIFEEIVADANTFWGRPAERPLLSADGIELDFEDSKIFYDRGVSESVAFDILHPAGTELGNTTGHNRETTDLVAQWVTQLPEKYVETKFIFLGYSKGAPIVLDIVPHHPELAERVLGYVTHAGVLQGAHAARAFLEQAESVLRDVPMGEFVERLRAEDPASLAQVISPLFSQLDMSWLSLPRVRAVFENLGYDTSGYDEQADRLLGGREVRELLDGARDLSPLECVRWSLSHFDNSSFPDSTYVFNLSGVADVSDFTAPVSLARGGEVGPSLVAPTFTEDGEVDWANLSIDALVLYFTSTAGFKNSPGGIFDAQVDLASSKSLHLDTRPLGDSLTVDELDTLWADPGVCVAMEQNGICSRERFATAPRSELIGARHRSNIDTVDLGEFRGHHWSLFRQALRPPPEISEVHAEWEFPRKAYMRALVQLLALRNLVDMQDGDNSL
ncbi:MAG: hypothetical protein GY811_20100 [Myxococcales bacterium]|nr:hypothetical protein [Myxococcales bacterium]